jgi:DNA-binding GntR family transcriptional regulator
VILDAVRSRDVQAAESLMRRHLDHTRGVWAGRAEAP